MIYSAETWNTTEKELERFGTQEMKMLRWMAGVTRKDGIRIEHVRGSARVRSVQKILRGRRLQWAGHVWRRNKVYVGNRMLAYKPGARRRGRPKTRWKDAASRDLKELGLQERTAQDRRRWRALIMDQCGDS